MSACKYKYESLGGKMLRTPQDCNAGCTPARRMELAAPLLRQTANHRCDAINRRLEPLGIAGETDPQERLATGAERGSRCKPGLGFIDQPHGEPPRVRLAVHREEKIKRALRLGEAHP